MKTKKITNYDGFEMTVQVADDDAAAEKPAPAKKAAPKPANKARATANKAK